MKINPRDIELRDAITEAEGLTKQETLTKRDEARVNFLLAKIASLRKGIEGTVEEKLTARFSVSDVERRWFRAMQISPLEALRVLNPNMSESELTQLQREQRDMLAGTQTITYTQTQLGGTLIPNEFSEDIFLGLAEVDPLFDKDFVTLLKTKGARPLHVPGWDLSSIQAARITEATQQPAGTFPQAATQPLVGWTYRVSLAASREIEDDAFDSVIKFMKMAFTIGFARGIGKDLVNGNGVNQPGGLINGVAASGITLNHNMLIAGLNSPMTPPYDVSAALADQIQSAYFSVNRVYRKAKTCGWIMNDDVYRWLRSLTDHAGRPLLDIRKDKEELMSKPILISPSMPGTFYSASPIVAGKIVFGDISRFLVRTSQMTLMRIEEAPGYIEKGEALYTAHMRADSQVHDPTGGGSPALVSIAVN